MKLRFVKFLTSRENEIEKKEGGEEGEGGPILARSTTSQLARNHSPLPFPFLFIISTLPPFTQSHQPAPPTAPVSPPPRVGRAMPSSYPSPSCSASPFLLHKITETAERGGKDRGGRPACRPSCNRRAPSSPPPLLLHPIGWPRLLSGSNGILSVAGGAIGKQSMKMNYPVSSPSLTNK